VIRMYIYYITDCFITLTQTVNTCDLLSICVCMWACCEMMKGGGGGGAIHWFK
jgi:hypothetical protein